VLDSNIKVKKLRIPCVLHYGRLKDFATQKIAFLLDELRISGYEKWPDVWEG
jgi:hypothetical protein